MQFGVRERGFAELAQPGWTTKREYLEAGSERGVRNAQDRFAARSDEDRRSCSSGFGSLRMRDHRLEQTQAMLHGRRVRIQGKVASLRFETKRLTLQER